MARAVIVESGLHKYLWTHALLAASHVRNHCFVNRIQNTPYGLITAIKPNLARLHIFGTICYPYTPGKKLDSRSKKGYFVDYDRNSPAYLVYYPESRTVGKHRLMTFTEKFQEAVDAEINTHHVAPPVKTEKPPEKSTVEEPVQQSYEPRYPRRQRQSPSYLEEYDCADTCIDYCYLMRTPKLYTEAMNCYASEQWKVAMDEEIKSLRKNDTFNITDLPESKTPVGGTWVFTTKGDPENPTYKTDTLLRFTAKLKVLIMKKHSHRLQEWNQ